MGIEFSIIDAPLTGVLLIDASAGTGKTYTISSLVVRLLIEKELSIDEILVVTYTEAAVDDLKIRVRQKIVNALAVFGEGGSDDAFLKSLLSLVKDRTSAVRRLTLALRNFDEAAIFTIHGFCRRVLNEYSLESGVLFESELAADQHDLLKEICEDFFRKNFYEASPLVAAFFYKDFVPANLLKKLGNIHAREEVRIIPEIDGVRCLEELAAIEPKYRRLFGELAALWPDKRKRVEDILLTDGALHRNKYRPASIPGWLAAMDGLTSLTEAPAGLFKNFSKFTPSSLASSVKAGQAPPNDDFFDLCGKVHDLWLRLEAVLADYGKYLEREFHGFVRAELKSRKQAAGIHSFDDLLTDLYTALLGEQGGALARLLRCRYPAAMIDEFQDTDPVQYEIFARIFTEPGSLLYLIGDPKQAIYSFRGADIFAYIRAVREIGNRYTLAENWRSVPGLVTAVNAFFGSSEAPFVFDEIIFSPARAAEKPRKFLEVDDKVAEPFLIWAFGRDAEVSGTGKLLNKEDAVRMVLARQTSEISRLLRFGAEGRALIGEQPLTAGDLAVLVRTNDEARLVRESLAGAGIASAINSSESLFASREAAELRILLDAVLDAGDSRKVRAALATRFIGADGRLLDAFGGDDEFLLEWLGKFREYRDLWGGAGFAVMFGAFLENESIRPRLLRLPEGERCLTNVLHLFEVLHLVCEEDGLGMAGLVKYLDERISSLDEHPSDEQQLRLESDADLVQIATIHKSKGLQYPVVFCPFCWGGSRLAGKDKKGRAYLFHDPFENGALKLDIGSADLAANRLHAVREEMAENLRLLYVALTRAIHCCYFAWGPFSGAGSSAAAYLLHGPGRFSGDGVGESAESIDYLKNLSDTEIIADLEGLAGRSLGAISLEKVESISRPEPLLMSAGEAALSCRQFNGAPLMNWRISSFSALSRKISPGPFIPKDTGDGEVVEPGPLFEDILSFPKGAAPGSFLHALLEELDFSAEDQVGRTSFLRERLLAAGYDPAWGQALAKMIEDLLATRLDPAQPGLVLAGIGEKARLNELEFYFPLDGFNPARLGELLGDCWPAEGWPSDKLRGFMKGYIDLVFCKDEKFYIVDWKSNFLGKMHEDYRPDKLRTVMAEEHYFLQYLIYTVALHRYLNVRLPGYDYEVNFGGIFYVFLRGLGGGDGEDAGVFRNRPSFSLISDLSDLFGG